MRVGAPVGTLHRLVPSDLEPPGGELSLHELGLSSLLAALPAVSSHPPEVVVIGAQVGSVRAFTEALSAPLQNAAAGRRRDGRARNDRGQGVMTTRPNAVRLST